MGVDARGFPGGLLRLGSHLCVCRASFLMTFATGRVPHSGPQQMVTAAMKLRHFLLGKKTMTNLDSILKNRDNTLPTKFHVVKTRVFPVVMYGCESWTIKKAECRRIDAFKLWCWRRLLRVPRTARRSN